MPLFLAEGFRIPGAPEWLSTPAALCALGAVALLLISLLLKGLQKIASVLAAIALIVAVCWFLRDAWLNKEKFLSPEVATRLDSIADSTLRSPQAQAAWEAAKTQIAKLTAPSSKSDEDTEAVRKKAIDAELSTRAAALKKEGHKAAAEEITRFRDQLRREKIKELGRPAP